MTDYRAKDIDDKNGDTHPTRKCPDHTRIVTASTAGEAAGSRFPMLYDSRHTDF